MTRAAIDAMPTDAEHTASADAHSDQRKPGDQFESSDDETMETMPSAESDAEQDASQKDSMQANTIELAGEQEATREESDGHGDAERPSLSVLSPTTSASPPSSASSARSVMSAALSFVGALLWFLLLELPLVVAFAAFVVCTSVQSVYVDYLLPQIQLMKFTGTNRFFDEVVYYHRICTENDITATSIDDLVIPLNATADEAMEHMLYHGASLYQNLLSDETANEMREFIVEQNKVQEAISVIKNKNRYSFGVDMNMHPVFQKAFRELVANEQFVTSLQKIVGSNPAIIELSPITSSYGAVDQNLHADIVPEGSGAKYARSYTPSYSLFLPLQDTTYDMGATHICPGSHLCSEGCDDYCAEHSLPVSGYGDSVWPRGSGALINQQTTHRGMAHNDPNGPDRVVMIITFAPRPQTHRDVETRQIGLGGSYSLKWTHWGHTLYDYIHADARMTEPQIRLRSLGLLPAGGYTWVTQASGRIANGDNGYTEDAFEDFMDSGGLAYWPKQWQAHIEDPDEDAWTDFAAQTLQLSKQGLQDVNIKLHVAYFALVAVVVLLGPSGKDRARGAGSVGSMGGARYSSKARALFRYTNRLVVLYCLVAFAAMFGLKVIGRSNWAKAIASGKAFRLPPVPETDGTEHSPTLPNTDDVLLTIEYASDRLASFRYVVDATHPGNRRWKAAVRQSCIGYKDMPVSVQRELADTMIDHGIGAGRFLTQNAFSEWTEVRDYGRLVQEAHKALAVSCSALDRALLGQVDALEADLRFSMWRGTRMNEVWMRAYVREWRRRLLPPLPEPPKHAIVDRVSPTQKSLPYVPSQGSIAKGWKPLQGAARRSVAVYSKPQLARQPSRLVKQQQERQEPFPAAWAEEGDIVEVQYACKGSEYYPAQIIELQAAELSLVVEYLDGEEEVVDQECTRTFELYRPGEEVDVRLVDGGSDWFSGVFVEYVRVNGEIEQLVVNTTEKGVLTIQPQNIRRIETEYVYYEDDDDEEEAGDMEEDT